MTNELPTDTRVAINALNLAPYINISMTILKS